MWRIAVADVAILLVVLALGMLVYLLLNNSSKTSKAVSKFLFRKDPVPENKPEETEKK